MLLSKSLVMAMKSYDISGVKVLCDGLIREKAAKTFVDKFKSKWNNALDLVEEECGNCTMKEKSISRLRFSRQNMAFSSR